MTSVAIVPEKLWPCCVVPLSRDWVMRTGIVVPAGMVTLRNVGGGGGGGATGIGAGAGAGGGVDSATAGARSMGAGSDWLEGLGDLLMAVGFAAGPGAGGGVATAAAGAGACTVRLLTTVLIPGTWAASEAARERAASLLTVPLRVATPFWTEVWIGSELSALSPEMRLWRAVETVASSVAGAGVELLQPDSVSATASTVVATRERDVGPGIGIFMRSLFGFANGCLATNNVTLIRAIRI